MGMIVLYGVVFIIRLRSWILGLVMDTQTSVIWTGWSRNLENVGWNKSLWCHSMLSPSVSSTSVIYSMLLLSFLSVISLSVIYILFNGENKKRSLIYIHLLMGFICLSLLSLISQCCAIYRNIA